MKDKAISKKRVTLMRNLACSKMTGIESKGMVLMAEDGDGKLKLLQPSEIAPGAVVS